MLFCKTEFSYETKKENSEQTKTNKYVLILPNIFLEQLAYQNM